MDAASILNTADGVLLLLFFFTNTVHLISLMIFTTQAAKAASYRPLHDHHDLWNSPLLPSVNVVIVATGCEDVSAATTAALELHYPNCSVVVVLDGPCENSFADLYAQFDLVAMPIVDTGRVAVSGRILGTYRSRTNASLLVLRKETVGSRGDACNAGINASEAELVALCDASTILTRDSLIEVAMPFVENPEQVVACAAPARPAAGTATVHGEVVSVDMPARMVSRVQTLEFMQGFLVNRLGWFTSAGLPLSGASFILVRRETLLAVGGYGASAGDQDAELMVRIRSRDAPDRGQVVMLPTPAGWVAPQRSWRTLAAQRRQWSTQLRQLLWSHRNQMLKPSTGTVGMMILPYLFVFGVLAPALELAAVVLVGAQVLTATISVTMVTLLLLASVGYSMVVSLAAAAISTRASSEYSGPLNAYRLVGAVLAKNVGYAQLSAVWRMWGLISRTTPKMEEPQTSVNGSR